jgi:hypothetical protein
LLGKGESEALISGIKDLNATYLNNTRCIILAIVPADVDFHNSQILSDARGVDPSTTRTYVLIVLV